MEKAIARVKDMKHNGPQRSTPMLPGTLKNLFFPPEEDEYKYFERAHLNPYTSRPNEFPNLANAAWAADAAMLCYARYGTRRMTDQEFDENLKGGGLTLIRKISQDATNWNTPGTQAFFAQGGDFAILAFRGTEADDPQDVHDDADLILVPEPSYKGGAAPNLGHLSSILHIFSEPCFVHRGFQIALNRVWDQVYECLAEYRRAHPDNEICLTGHSLGAALALLTYSRFRDGGVSVYTFGCPRVGNSGFRDRLADGGGGHFRCVNFNDLVTHVPLESALYMHVPQECYRFDEAGWLEEGHDGTLAADLSVVARVVEGLPPDLLKDPDKLV